MNTLVMKREFWDLSFSIALVAFSLVILNESAEIIESTFDPLGASFFPQLIAWSLIGLSCPLILKNLIALYTPRSKAVASLDSEDKYKLTQVILISILSVLYIFGITLNIIPFSLLTGGFLSLAIFSLNGFQGRRMPWVVIGTFVSGGGLEYLFTQVFVMDLPKF